ncbi:MAG: hypothetical protein M3336_02530, partial [Chloroflexota bacterium]|nr:hypothetical protein [Chloroflexota bacterium]
AVIAEGRVDARGLASGVGEHLAVWEHGLYAVVALDDQADARLAPLVQRYPPEQRPPVGVDARLDLGGGAVLDVYADGREPAAALSHGRVWLRLLGHPPPPEQTIVAELSGGGVSADGSEWWPALRLQ